MHFSSNLEQVVYLQRCSFHDNSFKVFY